MPHLPVTVLESSDSSGLLALVFGTDFEILNAEFAPIASTTKGNPIQKTTKGTINAAAFSRLGDNFALCTTSKELRVYSTKTWTQTLSIETPKRVNAITFDATGESLLTADKFGDVHRYNLEEKGGCAGSACGELVLGHVSILCDLRVSCDGKRLITCDRDEKLRVSKYPNAYNIQAFCLGHTMFVTSVCAPQFVSKLAVSGSGDGTVRVWVIETGDLVQTVDLNRVLAKYAKDRYGVLRVCAVEDREQIVVIVEGVPAVVVFAVEDGRLNVVPELIELPEAPVSVAVVGGRIVVSYASAESVIAVFASDGGAYRPDQSVARAVEAVATIEVEKVPEIQSIFVWGNKNFIEPTNKGNNAKDENN